jgi:hypothetical protein
MLNPLIYSRFSRDFRKAFKQILTCERERPTKKAIKYGPLQFLVQILGTMFQIAPASDVKSIELHDNDGTSLGTTPNSGEFRGVNNVVKQRFST